MSASLLVGAHFRPPARALLSSLKTGQELILRAEPDNPYDPDAMAVWLETETLSFDMATDQFAEFEAALASQGFTPEDIRDQPEWQLGYIAAAGNKGLRTRPDLVPNTAFRSGAAQLLWGPSGEAQVHQSPAQEESQP